MRIITPGRGTWSGGPHGIGAVVHPGTRLPRSLLSDQGPILLFACLAASSAYLP